MEISTSPIKANPIAFRVNLMARAHDSLAILSRRLQELSQRYGWFSYIGRLPDGRPTCLELVGGRASLTVYPSDCARATHALAKWRKPHRRCDVEYLSLSQCPWESMSPAMQRGLARVGVGPGDYGVMAVGCNPLSVDLELPLSTLQELLDGLVHANAELETLGEFDA